MFERRPKWHSSSAVALLLLLLFGGGVAFAQATKTEVFDRVERLRKEANDTYDKERASPSDKSLRLDRVQRFREVANALADYMKIYMTDKTSLSYLNNLYVLGAVSEGAENFGDAQTYYNACLDHVLIHDPQAKYNGKAILDLVNARLRVVQTATNRGRGGGGGAFPWSRARLMPVP